MSPTTCRNQGHEHRITRRFIFFAMSTAVVLAALLSPPWLLRNVSAAPGAWDLSFGQNGHVVLWPGYSVSRLAIQPDGKILVAHKESFGQYEFVVLDRYLPSGALEWRNVVPGSLQIGAVVDGPLLKVLVRSDGRIVVARTRNAFSFVAVFNSNGSVDASFGSDGQIVDTAVTDVGVLPDNQLVLLQPSTFSVYDADGAFIHGVVLPYMGFPDYGRVEIGKDGRIVTFEGGKMAIFNADFTPDSSFCPNGLCYNIGGIPRIANDGKIILATGDKVSRYLPNGSVDTGFGISGVVQLATTDTPRDVEVDDAGRVLVGMSARDPSSYEWVTSKVWVIEADGSSAGVMIDAGQLPPEIRDIALQENGKLLVSGWRLAGGVVGRYHYSDERGSVANLRFETIRTSPAETVRRGHEITYTIRVVNDGPAKAGHVTFENAVPNGTTFVSFEAPEGWVTYQQPRGFLGNKVSCSGYRLESGQSAEFQLTVRVNSTVAQGTQIINISQVSSLVPDPNLFNNTTFSTLTVQ